MTIDNKKVSKEEFHLKTEFIPKLFYWYFAYLSLYFYENFVSGRGKSFSNFRIRTFLDQES